MNDLKFKYKFNLTAYILIFLISAVLILSIVMCSLKLADILFSSNYGSDILVLVLSVAMIGVILIPLFFSKYTFAEDKLILNIGIFKIKVFYSKMRRLDYHKPADLLVLIFTNEKTDNVATKICIASNQNDEFMECIKKYNKSIKISTYDAQTE